MSSKSWKVSVKDVNTIITNVPVLSVVKEYLRAFLYERDTINYLSDIELDYEEVTLCVPCRHVKNYVCLQIIAKGNVHPYFFLIFIVNFRSNFSKERYLSRQTQTRKVMLLSFHEQFFNNQCIFSIFHPPFVLVYSFCIVILRSIFNVLSYKQHVHLSILFS